METVLRRGKFNSRMKDYYDIFYFLTKFKDIIDLKILKNAINNTFAKREAFDYLNDYKQILESINSSERMENQWYIYSNKYKYAKDIEFKEILDLVKKLLERLELEIVVV